MNCKRCGHSRRRHQQCDPDDPNDIYCYFWLKKEPEWILCSCKGRFVEP